MILNKFFKINTGYTLIELIVSISIIVILTALLLPNYHAGGRQNSLVGAIQQLSGNLRLVQNYAIGAKKNNNNQIPLGGWGIYLSASSSNYILYSDNNGDHNYTIGEMYRQVNLPSGMIFDDAGFFGKNSAGIDFSSGNLYISFEAPDPVTHINSTDPSLVDGNSVNIVIKDTKANRTKTISVNFFGLIDVN